MSFQTPLFKVFQRLFSIKVVQSGLIQKKMQLKQGNLALTNIIFRHRHSVKVFNVNIKCQIHAMTWSLQTTSQNESRYIC